MRTLTQDLFKGVTVLAFGTLLAASPMWAAQITSNFESLTDGDSLTNQITGLTFTNSVVVSSTGSLNAAEFPLVSGVNGITDGNGYILVSINPVALGAESITGFEAYFTYTAGLTVEALDAADNLLTSATSAFTENFVTSGNSPNELLSITVAGIRKLRFKGDVAGASMVVDDLTLFFDPRQPQNGVPEPASFSYVVAGLMFAWFAGAWGKLRK